MQSDQNISEDFLQRLCLKPALNRLLISQAKGWQWRQIPKRQIPKRQIPKRQIPKRQIVRLQIAKRQIARSQIRRS
jgi:hypothetical protein